MSFAVYILLCSDGTYYVGHTDNFEQRIADHQLGKSKCYTSSRLPVSVVFVEYFDTRDQALICERKIKNWSCSKKEALINKDWDLLKKLSKKNF